MTLFITLQILNTENEFPWCVSNVIKMFKQDDDGDTVGKRSDVSVVVRD